METVDQSYPEQVIALLQVAEEGVRLQPAADAAIRACGVSTAEVSAGGLSAGAFAGGRPVGAVVSDEVAVELGDALRAYSRLYYRLESFDPDPDLVQTVRDLRSQLSYHLHMLRDAGDLVFSGRFVPRNERFRRELANGLGGHAQGLSRLRNALSARSAILGEPR